MRFQISFIALLCLSLPAHAQMVLPGAISTPSEPTVRLPGSSGPAKPKIIINRIAAEDSVLDRILMLNGANGQMQFSKANGKFSLEKLTLAGNMISRPGDSCQVQVITNQSTPLAALGKPDGVLRYQNDAPACTFTLDILQGAVIVKSTTEICKFEAADCQVRPSGMWGPNAKTISESQISADVSARTQAEVALRASYKSLMERHSDRASVKEVAREQAAFTSQREEMCRNFVMEDKHGFCGARYSEFKVSNLRMRLGENSEAGAPVAVVKKHKKKRAAPAMMPVEPMQQGF